MATDSATCESYSVAPRNVRSDTVAPPGEQNNTTLTYRFKMVAAWSHTNGAREQRIRSYTDSMYKEQQ